MTSQLTGSEFLDKLEAQNPGADPAADPASDPTEDPQNTPAETPATGTEGEPTGEETPAITPPDGGEMYDLATREGADQMLTDFVAYYKEAFGADPAVLASIAAAQAPAPAPAPAQETEKPGPAYPEWVDPDTLRKNGYEGDPVIELLFNKVNELAGKLDKVPDAGIDVVRTLSERVQQQTEAATVAAALSAQTKTTVTQEDVLKAHSLYKGTSMKESTLLALLNKTNATSTPKPEVPKIVAPDSKGHRFEFTRDHFNDPGKWLADREQAIS